MRKELRQVDRMRSLESIRVRQEVAEIGNAYWYSVSEERWSLHWDTKRRLVTAFKSSKT